MTQTDIPNWVFLVISIAASIGLILTRNWKWCLIFLAIQYIGEFWFIQLNWNFRLALIKLVAGVIACLIIYLSLITRITDGNPDTSWPQGLIFRILGCGIVVLVTVVITPQVLSWLGIIYLHGTWVSIFLMGMGFLQLGLTTQPYRVIISLLTFLCGFEIIYAYLETSTLVTSLLVLVNLGLPLTGVFLFNYDMKDERY